MKEPNFFWSGSGDDPDAGMTYWITTTVYKTSIVTLVHQDSWTTEETMIHLPVEDITLSSKMNCTTTPTPTLAEAPYWIRTVLLTNADESSPRFRKEIQAGLARIYSTVLDIKSAGELKTNIAIQNISRTADGVEIVYALVRGHRENDAIDAQYAIHLLSQFELENITQQLCHRSLCQAVVIPAKGINVRLLIKTFIIFNTINFSLNITDCMRNNSSHKCNPKRHKQ